MMIPAATSGSFVLPKCPQELCFNADEFIKDSFSVDQFLQDHRRKANLEIMRDDLGIYLKTLRSAMIELINKDYTEFISLSTNLVDLDKRLDNIQFPIGQLSDHILQTREKLCKTGKEMHVYIKKKKELKLQRQVLGNIKHIEHSMKILNELQNCEDETVLLERILSEISFIQYHINSCKDKPEFEKISSNWDSMKRSLLFKIRNLLLRAFNNRESAKVSCYITVLVDLSDVSAVETLINEEILAPLLDGLISEDSLASDPRSLEGLYARLLGHVDNFKLMFDAIDSETFDFLVHCMVPQVLKRFTLNVKSIFAPGNADMFHRRYKESSSFLDELEERCKNWENVKLLRECEEYKQFNNSWNVSVYFQLRFQQISGKLEAALAKLHRSDLNIEDNKEWKLFVTSQTWECIQMCWRDQVFLPTIVRRLWKLTLQIISRFGTFCDETIKDDWPAAAEGKIEKTSFLVYLNSDLLWFKSKVTTVVDMLALKVNLSQEKKKCLEDSLEESLILLGDKVKFTEEALVDLVSKESLTHIRSVNDIPRHFRRTNREMPSEASAYVNSLVAPPLKFMTNFPGSKEWLLQIFHRITTEYFNSVKEVITSVQRTEESLRRFKKIREKSGGESKSGGVGDEEKIKQQISLDVQHYKSVVLKTGLKLSDVDGLSELVEIVERSLVKQTEE